jgi:general secretion pathway protein B
LAQEPTRRYWWVYLLVCTLLLNAALALWWLQPWKAVHWSKREAPPQLPALAETQNAMVAANAPAPTHQPANHRAPAHLSSQQTDAELADRSITKTTPNDKEPLGLEKREEGAQELAMEQKEAANSDVVKEPPKAAASEEQLQKSAESVKTPPPPPPQAAKAEESPAAIVDEAKPPKAATAAAKQATPKEPKAKNEQIAKLPEKTLDDVLTSIQKTVEPKVKPATPAAQGVPGLKNLPTDIQRELPKLTLSFLVYSDKPADRMLNINGQMMREGQEVAPGLKIEEITPEGAILSYKGHRFSKNVL